MKRRRCQYCRRPLGRWESLLLLVLTCKNCVYRMSMGTSPGRPIVALGQGQTLTNVHLDDDCAGPPHPNGRPQCGIHNPSAHHMRTWPMNWRSDRGLMERICPHGVGHPDPDHMAYARTVDPNTTDGVHDDCDLCCSTTPTEETQP